MGIICAMFKPPFTENESLIFFVCAIVTDNQIDNLLLKLAYDWKWVLHVIGYHLYTCNFKMYELKFMKCMLLPSN